MFKVMLSFVSSVNLSLRDVVIGIKNRLFGKKIDVTFLKTDQEVVCLENNEYTKRNIGRIITCSHCGYKGKEWRVRLSKDQRTLQVHKSIYRIEKWRLVNFQCPHCGGNQTWNNMTIWNETIDHSKHNSVEQDDVWSGTDLGLMSRIKRKLVGG